MTLRLKLLTNYVNILPNIGPKLTEKNTWRSFSLSHLVVSEKDEKAKAQQKRAPKRSQADTALNLAMGNGVCCCSDHFCCPKKWIGNCKVK